MSKAFDSISKGLRQAIAHQRGKRVRGIRRQVVAQQGPPFEIKAPNAVTIAAMRDARSMRRAKFRSAPELFNDLEEADAAKARKPAKKRR